VLSASPVLARGAVVASCLALLGAGAAGCSTTQEKAEHQKARSEHILKARAEREKANKAKHKKAGDKGKKHGKNSKDSEGTK
jgi:hypothetical protein